MSYAVIQSGGKQYKVKSGEILKIEKLPKLNILQQVPGGEGNTSEGRGSKIEKLPRLNILQKSIERRREPICR